jgi:hypothetical protein
MFIIMWGTRISVIQSFIVISLNPLRFEFGDVRSVGIQMEGDRMR